MEDIAHRRYRFRPNRQPDEAGQYIGDGEPERQQIRSRLRTARVGHGGDAGDGAIEEHGQQRRAADVDRQAPDGPVVVRDPVGDEISLRLRSSVLSRRGRRSPDGSQESGSRTAAVEAEAEATGVGGKEVAEESSSRFH